MLKEHGQSFRDLYESEGRDADKLCLRIGKLMEADGEKAPLLTPDDFSIREIHEAVDTTAFPLITGKLISKKLMDAFLAEKKVGDLLTTPFNSKLQIDKVPGVYEAGAMEKVGQGMPYGHSGDLKEKYVQIEGSKYGKILDITEEMIMFDQTGLVMKTAKDIGEGAAAFREKHIINTIQDLTGYRAYNPAGVETDLYSGGHANILTNKLEDETDLNAANILFGAMTKENGDPINVQANVILVPVALEMTAGKLYKSTVVVGGANAAPNPWSGRFNPIASPYLDANSAIIWYLGNFKKEFVWKSVIPMQVLTRKQGTDNDDEWNRDVKASFKTRYYGECGALDYRFVVRSTGAV